LTLVTAGPDALVSQLTRSAPLYGKHFWREEAFAKRFGATVGDDVSQIRRSRSVTRSGPVLVCGRNSNCSWIAGAKQVRLRIWDKRAKLMCPALATDFWGG
jgi:hypothetical protein